MNGPSPWLTKASLAAALEISETTVDEMVRRGVIPKPARLSPGCIRWRWSAVDEALASLCSSGEPRQADNDIAGVQRAIQAAKDSRRGRAA